MNISGTEVSTVGYENLLIFGNGYPCQRLSTVRLWIKALINKECYAVNAVNPRTPPFAVNCKKEKKIKGQHLC